MARSVALAACRATDPMATARRVMSRTTIKSSTSLARSTRNARGAWRIRPSVLIIRSPGQGGFIARSRQRMADVDTANEEKI